MDLLPDYIRFWFAAGMRDTFTAPMIQVLRDVIDIKAVCVPAIAPANIPSFAMFSSRGFLQNSQAAVFFADQKQFSHLFNSYLFIGGLQTPLPLIVGLFRSIWLRSAPITRRD